MILCTSAYFLKDRHATTQHQVLTNMGWGYKNEEYAHGIKKEKSKNNDIVNHHDHAQLVMKPESCPAYC